MKGKHGHESLCWFLRDEMGKAREVGLELASWNHFHRLRNIGAFPICLGRSPEMIREGNRGPERGSFIRAAVGGMNSALIVLHMKDCLMDNWFCYL